MDSFRNTSVERDTIGSGCGSVGRVVAANSRGPRLESSHLQKNYIEYLLSTVLKRRKNKEKEAGDGPFFKKEI